MPVVEVARWDLERLVGRKLSDEEIIDLFSRAKCEVEEISSDKVSYEAPHDRPDLFSVEGLARAVRLLLGIGSNDFNFIDKGVRCFNKGVPGRPYVAFAIVEDLELDDEAIRQLFNLQEKLHATYARDRRKASIGLYDLDKIKLPVYYELADPDETRFIPLDSNRLMSLREVLEETEKGRIYGYLISKWEKYPVLRDSEGNILSLPPIINAEYNKVTTDTKRVLIDSTGVDPNIIVNMVTIMATSVAERSRSRKIVFVDTVMEDNTIIRAPRNRGKVVEVKLNEAASVIGVDIVLDKMIGFLSRMGYKIVRLDEKKGVVEVVSPPYRIDVVESIDVVEDIAIAIGYDVIGSSAVELPPATHPGRIHPLEYISSKLRTIFVGMGFTEVANYMMSNPWIQNKLFNDDKPLVTVSNPKMEKYTCLRRWLLPGLLEVLVANAGKRNVFRIFEIGDVAIIDPESDTGARIERHLGFIVSHSKATLTDGLAVVRTLFETLKLGYSFRKKVVKGLLEKRAASILADGVEVGFVGEVDPRILVKLGIRAPVVVGEINLNKLVHLVS